MSEQDGLIAAHRLDAATPGRDLDWAGVKEAWPGDGIIWVHLDFHAERAQRWIQEESGLDSIVAGALLAHETRPRVEVHGQGLLVNLRGVNLNPGAEPDDMVSVRIWIDERRIVTVRLRRLMAIQDLRDAIERGSGPRTPDAFLDHLVRQLTDRMSPVIESLEDQLAPVEDAILEKQSFVMRTMLATIRQQAIGLRRYVGPQREALARLLTIEASWLMESCRRHLRESADRVTRIVEDLDAIRERAAVVQDELSNRLSDSMNRRMYALSVIAGLFLPLGLITGLLGINVAGIPGADTPWAFAAVCAGLVVIVIIEILIFRRLKWM
jgi:zinc transporter